jgi:hypothetical protein
MIGKGIGICAGCQSRPLHVAKSIRDSILLVGSVIDHDRQKDTARVKSGHLKFGHRMWAET